MTSNVKSRLVLTATLGLTLLLAGCHQLYGFHGYNGGHGGHGGHSVHGPGSHGGHGGYRQKYKRRY